MEFRAICEDTKEITITKSKVSAKEENESVSQNHFFRTARHSN